jgi:6-pyruvoyltetrahydropterin/6-carboxytetrahydropterin synthase
MRIELMEGLGFSAAHFIIGHKKCEHLHGHNWRVGVIVEGEPDERGLVVDFLELKQLLRQLCGGYDHRLLMPAKNPAVERLSEGENIRLLVHGREFEFPAEDVVWIPAVNTTVEELAKVIADEVVKNLSAYPNVERIKVLVEESPGESATEERRVRV